MAGPAGSSPRVVFLQEVGQHVHQGDVEKATRGEGQDPGHRLLCSRGRSPDWLGGRAAKCTDRHRPAPHRGADQGRARLGYPGQGSRALQPGPLCGPPPPPTPVPTPLGDCAQMAKQAPSRPPSAVESCSLAALHRSKPARSKMAKSPT